MINNQQGRPHFHNGGIDQPSISGYQIYHKNIVLIIRNNNNYSNDKNTINNISNDNNDSNNKT